MAEPQVAPGEVCRRNNSGRSCGWLLLPNRQRGSEIVRMEFRRFVHALILLPAQIVRAGRRIIFRIIAYNDWVKDLFAAWERLRCMRPT